MTVQKFIRRGTQSNATARRLIASSATPAPHVINATVKVDSDKQVIKAVCKASFKRGNAKVYKGESFTLVASKFTGRYYVIDARGNHSSSDERTIAANNALVSLVNIVKKAA